MTKRIFGRALIALFALAVLLLSAGGVWFWSILAASVARLDGRAALPGLEAEVTIERDQAGVPTVTAASRLDLVRALGFLHAQERYFQMDTIRRSGAGELSELVGAAALAIDRLHRLHCFRARAAAIFAGLSSEQQALLAAYAEGVNSGLAALAHKSFEYTLLGVEPAPWRPEDTLLAVYAMYFELQDSTGWQQRRAGLAEKLLGAELAHFLYPPGEPWDAALDGSMLADPPMPPPQQPRPSIAAPAPPPAPPKGSNAFAVSGSKTMSSRAIVAGDMHLPLRVPNIWYRARLRVRSHSGVVVDLNGVTLPGVPLLVAGSNGKIAWALTDSFIATGDAIRLDEVQGHPQAYMTPDGPKDLAVKSEQLCVAHGSCEELKIEETIWGPVVAREADGTRIVWRWAAHDGNAIALDGLIAFEAAATVREAFDAAHRAGLPQQNLIVVDREGHAGWTIMGPIPRRFGMDGVPRSWADGRRGWRGYLTPAEIPEIIDPPDGVLWSANNRAVGGDALALLGDSGYASASRAQQIRDDLRAKDHLTEADLLAIALDARASHLEPWRKLLADLIATRTDSLSVAMANALTNAGAATIDSIGYRLVRSFEEEAVRLIYGGFAGTIRSEAGTNAGPVAARRGEWPSLRLLSERPTYLVPPPFGSWNEVMSALLDRLAKRVRDEAGGDLSRFTWGNRNKSAIHHPLSQFVPFLGLLTDPKNVPLPGDTVLARTAAPGFGATERFVISPGHEEDGLFEMPVGEASNPLSPYFLAGHSDWVEGKPSPFLPGPPRWTLVLVPAPQTPGS